MAYITAGRVAVTGMTEGGTGSGTIDSGSTGTNRVIKVTVIWNSGSGRTQTLGAVSYNAVAMTSQGSAYQVGTGGWRMQTFVLVAPATGSNTLSVPEGTWGGGGGTTEMYASFVVEDDVDQTTPVLSASFTQNSASLTGAATTSLTIPGDTGLRLATTHFFASEDTSYDAGQSVTGFTGRVNEMLGGTGYAFSIGDGTAADPNVATAVTWSTGVGGSQPGAWGAQGLTWNVPSAGAPTIDTHPSSATKLTGAAASFTCAATTSGGTLLYQWQENDGGGYANISNGGIYSGATTATLSLSAVTVSETGYLYRCNVTDDNDTTASNAATLTVLAGDTLTQPSGSTDGAGELASGSFATDHPGSAASPVTTFRLVKLTPTIGGVECLPAVLTVRTP